MYTDQEIIDEFTTFLSAGTDTTAHFFNMMIYYIAQNPEIQTKVRKEIDSVIKDNKNIKYEDLKQLQYVEWLQLEVTRHYGPINAILTRIPREDHYLSDIPISKGTQISLSVLPNHYD